jgi:hypothetical protein
MRPPSAVTKALALIAAEAFATTCAAAEADDEAAIVALAS